MQLLIPALIELLNRYGLSNINLSQVEIDPYQINLSVKHLEDQPPNLPSSYIVEVSMFNILTARLQNQSLPRIIPATEQLPEDLRSKLIDVTSEAVQKILDLKQKGKWIPIEEFDLSATALIEEETEDDYRKRYVLTTPELDLLHSFHVPNRIPRGYTNEEVRLCILLHPVREQHRRLFPGFYPRKLHDDLFIDIDEPRSRTEALKQAIFTMYMDIISFGSTAQDQRQ
jgi:hypothetical protein